MKHYTPTYKTYMLRFKKNCIWEALQSKFKNFGIDRLKHCTSRQNILFVHRYLSTYMLKTFGPYFLNQRVIYSRNTVGRVLAGLYLSKNREK